VTFLSRKTLLIRESHVLEHEEETAASPAASTEERCARLFQKQSVPVPSHLSKGNKQATKKTADQLRKLCFDDVRDELLEAWIPCSGVRSKEKLTAQYCKKWQVDTSHLPLSQSRNNEFKIFCAVGRAGIQGYGNNMSFERFSQGEVDFDENPHMDDCLKTEDGYTAFMQCSACKKVSYCSSACQKAHWKRRPSGHKQKCPKLKAQVC